ncbi:MAG TPA: HD domain-containing protein [Gemmatimonadales bacterium]|nr:HD domain-containing protein [Gemmatimonadales bacterium]
MTPPRTAEFEVIRDPLWDNIRLDRPALLALDTAAVQRLRYIRQLGHAFLVYPGATHTRFEHALGAYHLTRRALGNLEERGELDGVPEEERHAVRLAALLHDIGHYPFSHALEEAGFPSHETLGVAKLHQGELGARLGELGGEGFAARVGALITQDSPSALQGLISGSLDLDKIDYLSRDAFMCGVPYGTVDVDRLLASLTLVDAGGRLELGVHEKGVSALESLLFAKYQMYRNVYWHHAVRAATCMFKRAVREAVARGGVRVGAIAEATDDGLMELLVNGRRNELAACVRARRLYKRALDLPASDLPSDAEPWVSDDPDLLGRVEDALAAEAGLARGGLLVDFPTRTAMLGVDLPLRLRDGAVDRLTGEGRAGQLGLPRVADELYRSARRLRVFVSSAPDRSLGGILDLVALPAEEIARRLDERLPLLPS